MVRGSMRGGRGGVRVGMRGTFKKASFSEFFEAGIFSMAVLMKILFNF